MVDKITVWSRQHESVLDNLMKNGRHTALKEYVAIGMEDHAEIMLEAYDWLAKKAPCQKTGRLTPTIPCGSPFRDRPSCCPAPARLFCSLSWSGKA